MADEAAELTRGDNYVITADDEAFIGKGSPKERVKNNLAALRLAKELAETGRAATIDEKRVLARFVGWGGVPQAFVPEYDSYRYYDEHQNTRFGNQTYVNHLREQAAGTAWGMEGFALNKEIYAALGEEGYEAAKKSTQNAHFTAIPIIRAMHKALRRMGVAGGRFLEPAAGIGHFIGTAEYPGKTEWVGVELDEGTGRILKSLYPDSKTFVQGFETVNVPDGFFDVAMSNVPFGNYPLHDPRYNKHSFLIHDYFFAKSLDKVRPGGVVAFITSAGTMDKQDSKLRHFIGQNGGQFMGAVRMPDSAFAENANTKVVTDIIFIRKLEQGEKVDNAAWDGREAVKAGDGEVVVNKYFADHPEQVMGEFSTTGTMYHKDAMTVTAKGGADLAADLDAALSRVLPEGSYAKKTAAAKPDTEQRKAIFDEKGLKDGNLDVVGGKLMRKEGELVERFEIKMPRGSEKVNKEKVVRSLSAVRDALRELVKGQLENCDEGRLTKLQGALTKAYNAFVKEHGYLNKRENEAIIRHDLGDGQRLLALEMWDAKAKKADKSAIFSTRVITAQGQRATSAGSAVDAYYIALNETGGIDPARMAELTGKPADAILRELEEGGHIFHNPETAAYEQSEDYLSGRVRKKLLAAKGAVALDARYARNVAALEKVQPEDVPVEKISFALGQAWIPVDVWQGFARYICGFDCGIIHNEITNAWQIIPKVSKTTPGRFGTDALKGYRILQALMNGAAIRVTDRDGHVNQVETDKAQEKANKIAEVFPNWLLDDDDRKAALGRLYNDVMNDNVPREWDASRMDIKGLSAKWRGMMDIAGREYQKRAVVRGVTGGNLLLAHAVGAGKTVEMASIAMELRRMGLARKNIFVVPNHMLEQWGREFSDAFPAANVLVARKSEMQGDKRKRFTARIANGDWDAVIMAHSTYSKIGMSAKAQAEYVEEEVAEIRTAVLAARDAQRESGKKTDSRIVKQLEAMLARAEAKLQKLLANEGKDKVVTFEELGADYLFVDEAHNFKGIAILTKNGRIPGLGQQTSFHRS